MATDNGIDISIVIPMYNTKKYIYELYDRLIKQLVELKLRYEIIFIDDRCGDNSWEAIVDLAKKDAKIIGIKLSQNFGQHNAITAGLNYCKGEYVCVMDADLQDLPEEISKLYKKIKNNNCDIVVGRRVDRKDSYFKKLASYLFYKLLFCLSGVDFDYNIGNFGIYKRKVINAYLSLQTSYRFFPLDIRKLGFNYKSVDLVHGKRIGSKSSYSFFKLLKLAKNNILYFSSRPLTLILYLGGIIAMLSFLFGFFVFMRYLFGDITVPGWTSIMISIYFLFGLVLGCFGCVGLYVQKIFEETQKRQLYIIDDMIISAALSQIQIREN